MEIINIFLALSFLFLILARDISKRTKRNVLCELLPIKIGSFCRGLLPYATLPYTGGHHTLLPLSDRKFTCQNYGYFCFLLFCFPFLHIPSKFRRNPFRATGYVKYYFKKNFKNVKRLYLKYILNHIRVYEF